ncbi:MAG: apolipoprotein N-acyltransferase [Endomicrobium sp.]|nr:apolipoprotein N-acyltransferase [Endomicrobium sp.]
MKIIDCKRFVLCIATGLLAATAFPKINLFFLMWVAFVPLIYVVMESGYKGSFCYGFISGFVFNAVGMYWLYLMLYSNTKSCAQALIASSLLWIYLALYWSVWGGCLCFIRNAIARKFRDDIIQNILLIIAGAAMWVVLEYIRTYFLTGFSWMLIAYSQFEFTSIVQIAEFTGVYGVSFILMFCNLCLHFWISKRVNKYLYIALVLIVAFAIFGAVRSNRFKSFGEQEFSVSIVQPNIDQNEKWDAAFSAIIYSNLRNYASEISKNKTDLVLWPETAFTELVPNNARMYESAKEITTLAGGLNIVGSPFSDDGEKVYNAVVSFENGGDYKAVHKKNCLIPFGEYVPFRELFAQFFDVINHMGDLERGTDTNVFDNGKLRVGSTICSENFYPDISRRFVFSGAKVLSNHANDGWFFDTAAPSQHFAMNVFRAVETRKAMLVSANSGISGFIEASGVIVERTQLCKKVLLRGTFFQNDFKTFYTKFGDLFVYVCIGIILSVLLLNYKRRKESPCLGNRKKE